MNQWTENDIKVSAIGGWLFKLKMIGSDPWRTISWPLSHTPCQWANRLPDAKAPDSVYRSLNHCYFLLIFPTKTQRVQGHPTGHLTTFPVVLQGNVMLKMDLFQNSASSQMRNYRKDGLPWKIPRLQVPNVFITELKTQTCQLVSTALKHSGMTERPVLKDRWQETCLSLSSSAKL